MVQTETSFVGGVVILLRQNSLHHPQLPGLVASAAGAGAAVGAGAAAG